MGQQLRKGVFVFFASENGRDNWMLVSPSAMPAWALEPDVLGNMVNGFVAMKCNEGPRGSLHYRAEVKLGAQDAARLKDALEKRGQQAARELLYERGSDAIVVESSTLEH